MQYWRLIKEVGSLNFVPSDSPDLTWGNQIPDNFVSVDHPKLTFNFTMEIAYWPTDAAGTNTPNKQGNSDPSIMSLALKTASRPQPIVNYTDVNFYNFRTKVAIKVEYGTTTVVFYDDGTNNAHSIYQSYLNTISPISNITTASLIPSVGDPFNTTSSIGPLVNPLGVIQSISVFHFYTTNYTRQVTTYVYMNPRIVNFVLDDLNMTQSEASTVSMTFAYDAVYIIPPTVISNANIDNASAGSVSTTA